MEGLPPTPPAIVTVFNEQRSSPIDSMLQRVKVSKQVSKQKAYINAREDENENADEPPWAQHGERSSPIGTALLERRAKRETHPVPRQPPSPGSEPARIIDSRLR